MADIDFELRLKNEVSAAAKQAGVDVRQFQYEVIKAQESLYLLTLAQGKESRAARESKEAHDDMFGDVFKAEVLKDGVEDLAGKVFDLGKEFVDATFEAADFGYKTDVALTAMTGSAEAAEDIVKHARAFASGAGEDIEKVISLYQQLGATGLKGDELTKAATAAKDFSIASGKSEESIDNLFSQIAGEGGLGPRAASQLRQFPQLLSEMFKDFGIKGKGQEGIEELQHKFKSLGLHGAEGVGLLEREIVRVAHEKEIGDVAEKYGESFQGSFQKIKNDWNENLEDMTKDPAFADLRKEFKQIADYFDPKNVGGAEMRKELEELIKPVLDGAKYFAEHPKALKDFFDDAVESAKILANIVGFILKPIEAIGHLALSYDKLLNQGQENADAQHAHDQGQQQQAWAQQLVAQGLSPADAADAVKAAGTPTIPAKADGGDVQSTGLVTVHEGERIVPASVTSGVGGGAGGHTFNFNLSLPMGSGEMDEQALAARLQEMVPGAIINALEQMNQMRGGQ